MTKQQENAAYIRNQITQLLRVKPALKLWEIGQELPWLTLDEVKFCVEAMIGQGLVVRVREGWGDGYKLI